MKQVRRHILNKDTNAPQPIRLPKHSEFLSAQGLMCSYFTSEKLILWILVDQEVGVAETRHVLVVDTHAVEDIPNNSIYIGTGTLDNGETQKHVFEIFI